MVQSAIRQHTRHQWRIGRMNDRGFPQLSFPFGGFFGQNMTLMRLFTFKTAGAGSFEPFASAAMAFNFGHLFSPIKIK
jgi:hypothetical protein